MKFKDKDGNVLNSIYDVWVKVCSQNRCGNTCPLFINAVAFYPSTINCGEWARDNPIVAAYIMGYEIIEEEEKNTISYTNDHPCQGCDTGWGCATVGGKVESCEDTCEKLKAYLEAHPKPIKDWTLGEVVERCAKYLSCDGCKFKKENGGCKLTSRPDEWCLEEKPRFTKEEIEIAKAIKLLIPEATVLQRGGISDKLYLVNDDRGFPADFLTSEKFPGLRAGESINLADIIREG